MNISKKRLYSLLDKAMWSAYGVSHRENVQDQHDEIIKEIIDTEIKSQKAELKTLRKGDNYK